MKWRAYGSYFCPNRSEKCTHVVLLVDDPPIFGILFITEQREEYSAVLIPSIRAAEAIQSFGNILPLYLQSTLVRSNTSIILQQQIQHTCNIADNNSKSSITI